MNCCNTCNKRKTCCGCTGPAGNTGPTGPAGPTGTFAADYVISLSAPSAPNQTPLTVTNYYDVTGPLATSFNPTTGIFTAPITGYYLITANVTFQRITNETVQIDDGTRQIRIVRPYLPLEPAFIGQSVWVTLPEQPSGPFYQSFNVKTSAAGAFAMSAGQQIYLTVYQDNSGANTITAFTELSITKLANLPALLTSSPIGGPIGF